MECCLQHGLKKRALGLFKNSTTTALLHKISKQCEPAAQVVRVLTEVEQNHENARSVQYICHWVEFFKHYGHSGDYHFFTLAVQVVRVL